MSGPYDVLWAEKASDSLLVLMSHASDLAGLGRDVDSLQNTLRTDPETKGTLASEGLWRITVGRLVALYEIHEDDSQVSIEQIGLVTS